MKTQMLPQIIFTAALALGFAASAHAEEKPVPPGQLKKYDKNGDGKLDESEKAAMKADAEKKKAEQLAKYDTDKDGKLSKEERAAMQEEMKKKKKGGEGGGE